MSGESTQTRIPGYCALCWSSCGCVSVVEDGKLVAVEPDPEHPTGSAMCGKGQAAPEYVYSKARVLYPMKRTRPKGDPDPGWERISWDEALDTTAEKLRQMVARNGARSIAFSQTTSAGTAMQDSAPFVERLRQAFGTPNEIASIELCDFGKDFMYAHTFGVPIPMSEVDRSDCIILWGHNPTTTWLAFGTRVAEAKRRGAKLVVMDPLRAGLATKADEWLRVRPGTDGALALSMAHVMIDEGLIDETFVRTWTNGPFLIREDTGAMLRGSDLAVDAAADTRVAWDEKSAGPVLYDSAEGAYQRDHASPALRGSFEVATVGGPVTCRTAFEHYADLCAQYPPERTAEICWLPAEQITATARLIGSSRAVSCYAWAGLEMHSNTSQTGRAISCLYALTGCFDAPGGNVILDQVPTGSILGREFMPEEMMTQSVGLEDRPLGPEAIFNWITTDAFYDAVLERKPYGVDGLVSFGLNMLLSHADGERGTKALEALEFMVHADLFMTPTAKHADIFLPVNTPWEREALKTDFLVDQRASGTVQLRRRVIEPLGESRSDAWIAIELAKRLGLSDKFWDGDQDGGWREILEPSGLSLDDLRADPRAVEVPLETRYHKYREEGFDTPSGRVEIFSETLGEHGYAPLPEYVEPAMGPVSRADLVEQFPLVLTDTKSNHFIHSQYRHVPQLRRREREPRVEMHPELAEARGIVDGDLVEIVTPHAASRMQARLVASLDPRVVRTTVGWWQGCDELGLSGYESLSNEGANHNRMIDNANPDPIGGCVAHKSYLCDVRKAAPAA